MGLRSEHCTSAAWGELTSAGQPTEYRAGMAPHPVSDVDIVTASEHPREVSVAADLREQLTASDVDGLQWTSRVVIEDWAVPHSHPILTLNTRHEGDRLLTTYLHEQLHWWGEQPQFDEAIGDTQRIWPTVPDADEGGARDEYSTRLHLLLCHLERRAMHHVVGPNRAGAVFDLQLGDGVYPWIYRQTDTRADVLDAICSDRRLWPPRLEPAAMR